MVHMKDLAAICTGIGFLDVRTYLNSGNVIFRSPLPEKELQRSLEAALYGKTGKDMGVVIRSAGELERIVAANPFPDAVPSQVGVLLSAAPVPEAVMAEFSTPGRERVVRGDREVYIHYPDGMGRSKLRWPASLRAGTMRNIATIMKLAGQRAGGGQ